MYVKVGFWLAATVQWDNVETTEEGTEFRKFIENVSTKKAREKTTILYFFAWSKKRVVVGWFSRLKNWKSQFDS